MGGCVFYMNVINSQSKNPGSFVPPNNNYKWLFDLCLLGHFFGKQATENANCESDDLPPLHTIPPLTLGPTCRPSPRFCSAGGSWGLPEEALGGFALC